MPCKVDLFDSYKWYDHYDLADHMYFNTPLVPLMCEVIKLIESTGKLNNCSSMVQEWYKYHKEDDQIRRETGKRIRYSDKKNILKLFIEHMHKVGFQASTGILTDEEIKWQQERDKRREEEYAAYKAQEEAEKERQKKEAIKKENRYKVILETAMIAKLGNVLSEEERKKRMKSEIKIYPGQEGYTELFYVDGKLLVAIDKI